MEALLNDSLELGRAGRGWELLGWFKRLFMRLPTVSTVSYAMGLPAFESDHPTSGGLARLSNLPMTRSS